jgi:prepilin-type N-terminal cleavage/methylation domain-containing protein
VARSSVYPRSAPGKYHQDTTAIVPQPFTAKQAGFTLVEIILVAAIVALLAASAVPGFMRARKRSQVSRILSKLRSLDSATDQYGSRERAGDPMAVSDWTNYLNKGTTLRITDPELFSHDHGAQSTGAQSMAPFKEGLFHA